MELYIIVILNMFLINKIISMYYTKIYDNCVIFIARERFVFQYDTNNLNINLCRIPSQTGSPQTETPEPFQAMMNTEFGLS